MVAVGFGASGFLVGVVGFDATAFETVTAMVLDALLYIPDAFAEMMIFAVPVFSARKFPFLSTVTTFGLELL